MQKQLKQDNRFSILASTENTQNMMRMTSTEVSQKNFNIHPTDEYFLMVAFELISDAVEDLKFALSINDPEFPIINFSRIVQCCEILRKNKDKYKLNRDNELNDLFKAVKLIRHYKSDFIIFNNFKFFLFSIEKLIKFKHFFLPTSKMIKLDQKLNKNRNVWYSVKDHLHDCCSFILGENSKMEKLDFSYGVNESFDGLNELIREIESAAKLLQQSLL